jgi:protein-S-isoprenylcysteine O-methyltransferase Ste14
VKLFTAAFLLLFCAAALGSAFLIAGTWKLPFFWIAVILQHFIAIIMLQPADESLVSERGKPKGADRNPSAGCIQTGASWALLWIAAADVGRWHIAPTPLTFQITAIFFAAIGWFGFYWSMSTNKFFSTAIRLQPDRQQQVITSGPYKWVRHPGYVFISLAFLSQAIILGSWLSEIPALVIVIVLLYRTLLEEKMLANGLSGYNEYKAKVRYRWLPGIW